MKTLFARMSACSLLLAFAVQAGDGGPMRNGGGAQPHNHQRTYFGSWGTGTPAAQEGPPVRYDNPWAAKILGFKVCRTPAEDYAALQRKYAIVQARHQVEIDRLNWAAYNNYHNPKPNSLAGFLGSCGCGTGGKGKCSGCPDAQCGSCGGGCDSGCGGYGACTACKGRGCKACGLTGKLGFLKPGCSTGGCATGDCGTGGCGTGCGGHGGLKNILFGGAYTSRSARLGDNALGAGMAPPPAGYGQGYGYPMMNPEEATRYLEGFQYYPPNHLLHSPRDFFMHDVKYGVGR